MQTKTKLFYTPEEYLARERVAEAKSEYYKGGVFAFAGASFNHNLIAANTLSEINSVLKFKFIDASIALKDIYHKVKFEEEK